ncbi:unnamed protein product [Nesidiocoris tenuis]|uniref:RRM domain-containing protein n=1 Tax=Nesidiocoris tenuis TaxID=355587 RepID=A0A6H5G6L4_9HEMI|nr:unnamed protein product [Nesidiocoris tenuis]
MSSGSYSSERRYIDPWDVENYIYLRKGPSNPRRRSVCFDQAVKYASYEDRVHAPLNIFLYRRRSGETSYLHFVKTATVPMAPYVTTLNFHDISNVHVQVRKWRYEVSPLRRRYFEYVDNFYIPRMWRIFIVGELYNLNSEFFYIFDLNTLKSSQNMIKFCQKFALRTRTIAYRVGQKANCGQRCVDLTASGGRDNLSQPSSYRTSAELLHSLQIYRLESDEIFDFLALKSAKHYPIAGTPPRPITRSNEPPRKFKFNLDHHSHQGARISSRKLYGGWAIKIRNTTFTPVIAIGWTIVKNQRTTGQTLAVTASANLRPQYQNMEALCVIYAPLADFRTITILPFTSNGGSGRDCPSGTINWATNFIGGLILCNLNDVRKLEWREKKRKKRKRKNDQELRKFAKRETLKRKPVDRVRKKSPKAGRLVIRNLPFKVTEDSLRDHFSTFGTLEDVHLLKNSQQQFTGCAFVQFSNKLCAAKALAKTSGRDFKGRTIIVDWAVSKDRYKKILKGGEEVKTEPEDTEVKKESDSDEEKPDVEELNRSIEIDDDESERLGFDSEGDEDDGREDEERGSSDDDDDDDDESGIGDDESEVEEMDREVKPRVKSERFLELKKKHQEEDQLNLRTLFVKNVPFTATNEDFRKAAEVAGPVSYALVVMDKMTEHSRGTGFIRYEDKDSADSVLSGQVKLIMRGIELQVMRARKKNNDDGENDGKKLAKDSRNLYLAKEGVILAGSPAAEGVSEGDVAKRLKLEQWKTTVLRNLHMFISPVRLVVHNIPLDYDDKKLFSLFKKNSPKGSFITEARIMKTINDAEVGKSKGYGFVTFRRHEDALQALRRLASLKNLDKKKEEVSSSTEVQTVKGKFKAGKRKRKASGGDPKSQKSTEPPTKRGRMEPKEAPGYAGVASKFGNKKLMTKRQIVSQAEKHRLRLKRSKKQVKLSRKQKRLKKIKKR